MRYWARRSWISRARCRSWRKRASCRRPVIHRSERGPEHAKTFTIEARVGRDWAGQAEGCSKKSAARSASRDVLAKLKEPARSP